MSGPLPSGAPPGLGYTPASGGSYGGLALGALGLARMQAQAQAANQLQSFQAFQAYQATRGWEPPLPRERPRVGELIGYRAWRVITNRLYSVSMVSSEWAPGMVMSDRHNAGLEIADHNYVGVWAFNNPHDLESQFGSEMEIYGVLGTVWMWGTVIEHERGYRAQYASVRSLDKAAPNIDLGALRAAYLKKGGL